MPTNRLGSKAYASRTDCTNILLRGLLSTSVLLVSTALRWAFPLTSACFVFQRFTSAGGNRRWEKFVLPARVMLGRLEIVAVEGPDIEDYPSLRVSDCRVLGKPYSPGSTWVSSASGIHGLDKSVEDVALQSSRLFIVPRGQRV